MHSKKKKKKILSLLDKAQKEITFIKEKMTLFIDIFLTVTRFTFCSNVILYRHVQYTSYT